MNTRPWRIWPTTRPILRGRFTPLTRLTLRTNSPSSEPLLDGGGRAAGESMSTVATTQTRSLPPQRHRAQDATLLRPYTKRRRYLIAIHIRTVRLKSWDDHRGHLQHEPGYSQKELSLLHVIRRMSNTETWGTRGNRDAAARADAVMTCTSRLQTLTRDTKAVRNECCRKERRQRARRGRQTRGPRNAAMNRDPPEAQAQPSLRLYEAQA